MAIHARTNRSAGRKLTPAEATELAVELRRLSRAHYDAGADLPEDDPRRPEQLDMAHGFAQVARGVADMALPALIGEPVWRLWDRGGEVFRAYIDGEPRNGWQATGAAHAVTTIQQLTM